MEVLTARAQIAHENPAATQNCIRCVRVPFVDNPWWFEVEGISCWVGESHEFDDECSISVRFCSACSGKREGVCVQHTLGL